ncbi:MAG TPA: dihydroneopterin aldolase [Acidobacteriota bacterium]|jgi:dihydroneopterin aldolase|nr:dihydroneopterin aldolase [Acidobacteriota bacterium]
MDKILIRGLKCELKIGVEAEERRYPQICLVDLELNLDLAPATRSDSVHDTVDYALLCDQVRQAASAREYHLVESFAQAIAEVALQHESVREVRVFVEKTPLPLQGKLQSVGVEVTRRKK